MSKYQPLQAYLSRQQGDEVPMSFKDIEDLVGGLPASSRYRAWWSNNAFNSVMTKAWLDAGFKTERVNMTSKELIFRRTAEAEASASPAESAPVHFKAFYGGLRGTITVNFDLTAPAADQWNAAYG